MSKVSYFIHHKDEPKYEPSAIAQVSFTQTDDCSKFHSDVRMILRDKSLSDRIGVNVLRDYVDRMVSSNNSPTADLSDDELMDTILDRRVVDPNDVYQMTNYLDKNLDNVKDNLAKMKKSYEQKKKLLDSLKVDK